MCIYINYSIDNCYCEGIYADVQWIPGNNMMEQPSEDEPDQHLELKFKSEIEKNLYRALYAELKNDLEAKMQLAKGDNMRTGKEVDKIKFQWLIAEYKKFKRNYVQHFRFNFASNHTAFGQFLTRTFASTFMLHSSRGRDSFNS